MCAMLTQVPLCLLNEAERWVLKLTPGISWEGTKHKNITHFVLAVQEKKGFRTAAWSHQAKARRYYNVLNKCTFTPTWASFQFMIMRLVSRVYGRIQMSEQYRVSVWQVILINANFHVGHHDACQTPLHGGICCPRVGLPILGTTDILDQISICCWGLPCPFWDV